MSDKNFLENIALVKDTIKTAIDLAQKSNDTPFLEKLYEARNIILNLQEENQELRSTVLDLKNLQRIKENLLFKYNSYWKKETETSESGPFCSTCLDSNNKLIRLIKHFETNYKCNNCQSEIDLDPDRYQNLTRRAITDDYDP